ncbi:MAG: fluoride efflux transporter CrcB [Magnetococcales bacterium]|nr:fluoride efflux transporter CrcB [Magnetococcales bacterium]
MGQTIAAIALGGAAGSVARYLMAQAVASWLGRGFPWGTLSVNILGSMAMGVLFQLFTERLPTQEIWRLALMVGVLGGFTTFSSFSLESVQLFLQGEYRSASAYIAASVGLCLVGTWMGWLLARTVGS